MASRSSMEASNKNKNGILESFQSCRSFMKLLVGRIVSPHEIEDIVQETFVLSYAASRTKKIKNPRAFMLKVARNIALDHVKKPEYRLNCSLGDLDEELFLQTDTPELQCQSQEKFLFFCSAVANLPLACRRAFILKKVYGLSLKEICEHLDISPSTAEKHVAKGMCLVLQQLLHIENATEGQPSAQGDYAAEEVKTLD